MEHKLSTFWSAGRIDKGYGWACTCGQISAPGILYGTQDAAIHAGENLHTARFMSKEEIRAKKQEERDRIKARSQEILARFVS